MVEDLVVKVSVREIVMNRVEVFGLGFVLVFFVFGFVCLVKINVNVIDKINIVMLMME